MASVNTIEPVRIDSRKFLSALNDSAQSKVAVFEERVQQMGNSAGKQWRLAALHAKNLYIEDVKTHQFYIAEHVREPHGKVTITNIKPLEIVEEEKQSLFSETCTKLVSAIEENDQKGMQVAFDRMKAQRFSGRAVPYSGAVRCRDGVLRHINIRPNNVSLEDNVRSQLVSVIVESLRDRVIVENGSVVSGSFSDGAPVNLPVTKWASRKLVARRMMEAAKNAYWSEGFQNRVYHTAKLVSESKIDAAVQSVTPFLEEMEEFTLLNRAQIQTLVENALAAKAIFNQQLCDDTATLIFRTNMKLSRGKIIDEWRNIAKKAEHPALMENVRVLQESKNFESAYQKFLSLIFEAISNREVAAEALATTLDILKSKTPKIRESHELSSKLSSLINRLKDKNFDDAAIYEAEDLIATIQEELAAGDTLQGFDQMPPGGGPSGDTSGVDLGGDLGGSGAPVININSPLIQIGGQSSASGGKPGPEMPDETPPPPEAGGDEDLDALLGGAGGAPAAPAAPPTPGAGAPGAPGVPGAPAPMENKRKKKKPLSESRPVHYEMKDEDDDDMPGDEDEIEESRDPYAIRSDEGISLEEGVHITDYGTPIISDEGDLQKIIRIMHRLATENKLVGKTLEQNLPSMAKASIKALGIRIPESKMPRALEQVVTCFLESDDKPFPGAAPPFKKKGDSSDKPSGSKKPWETDEDCDSCDDSDSNSDSDSDSGSKKPWETDDEGVAEDQYHSPKIPNRGYGRSSIKTASEGRIKWGKKQEDAILGEYAGVRFIFDHGGSNESLAPVILSEDGSVEIPIPETLYDSAFAAARMAEGDPRGFTRWIGESIEQLRPIDDGEDSALNEAMAKITTGPDGTISVEVSDDIDVGEIGAGAETGDDSMIADMGENMDDAGDDMGMSPVDSISAPGDSETGADAGDVDDDAMPDFENDGDSMGGESMGGTDDGGTDSMGAEPQASGPPNMNLHDEEEEGMAEDQDITSPSSSKYTKHVKDNLRDMPTPKVPKATDDELEDIGPTVKKDDGTGTKPPTARKGD